MEILTGLGKTDRERMAAIIRGTKGTVSVGLTGARAGRAIEPRNHQFGVPTPSPWWKATRPVALCESLAGPARSENHGMYGTFMRENREIPRLARPADGAGRAASGTPRRYAWMNGDVGSRTGP